MKAGRFKIIWECDDGYAGGSAPQYLSLTESELLDYETVDEAMSHIEECIQDDFNNKVSWTCKLDDVRKEVEELFASKKDEAAT